MIRGTAFGKVNLGLRVGDRREDGFHTLSGIFQSVDLSDDLSLDTSESDSIATSRGRPVPAGTENLALRAAVAVRTRAGAAQPLRITLDKSIPTAAGLGGGSADAAAMLAMAGRLFGIGMAALEDLAPELGSDVPFCLRGGTALVSGRGERLTTLDGLDGFALGIVVPPFELSTGAVFDRWDEMSRPAPLQITAAHLPPALRSDESIINDLYRPAVAIQPNLDDWRTDLAAAWGRPVMLSGSGPSLYGFFLDRDEAEQALEAIPAGARAAEAADLTPVGWTITATDEG